MSRNKINGYICQWIDERGFGFIKADNHSEKIFFHISKIMTQSRKPQTGDKVTFELEHDFKQRINACNIYIDGVTAHHITPKQYNLFDYLFLMIVLITVIFTGLYYFYYQQISINKTSLLLFIPAVISCFLLSRTRKPKEKYYYCASCYNQHRFHTRTIRAWNNGATKFYCKHCFQPVHYHNQPIELKRSNGSNGSDRSGCLGSIIILLIIPVFMLVKILEP